jgi:hypothetical protein
VLVATGMLERIDPIKRQISVRLTRDQIQQASSVDTTAASEI